MNNIKFAHFTDAKYTIGYRINDTEQKVEYAIAYTHDNDTYNHKIGRNVVSGRINKGGLNKNGKERALSIPFSELNEALGGEKFSHGGIVSYLNFIRKDPAFTANIADRVAAVLAAGGSIHLLDHTPGMGKAGNF